MVGARVNTNHHSAVDKQGTVRKKNTRGGKRIRTKREKRKVKSAGLRLGNVNVERMTGEGRELATMMLRM